MVYDIAIIGAGAAGMTAALYALRANKKIILLESTIFGGQILQSPLVENYPALPNISGETFSRNLFTQLQELGFSITYQNVIKLTLEKKYYQVHTKTHSYQAKTVILATGTISRKLNLPGEDQLIGKGLAFCATCDGALFKNQDVAVVGGGNSAVLSAIYLSELCQNIFLIHRRSEFRAEELLFQKLKQHPNIYLILNNQITSLVTDRGVLSGVTLKTALSTNQNSTIPGFDSTSQILAVKALFIEIGRIFPSTEILQDLIKLHGLTTDQAGFILADENCKTKLPGFFAAGDCRAKDLQQLVTATADGALAASAAIEFLN